MWHQGGLEVRVVEERRRSILLRLACEHNAWHVMVASRLGRTMSEMADGDRSKGHQGTGPWTVSGG